MNYFYTDLNNQAKGPVSMEELRRLLRDGEVNAFTKVAVVGSTQWSPISTLLPELTPPAPTETEPLSVVSLVLGVLGLFVSFACCAGFLLSIPAVICGHISLAKVKRTPALQGRGLAIAGLVCGYLGLVIYLVLILFLGGVVALGTLEGEWVE